MKRIAILALTVCVLAGCGQPEPKQAEKTPAVSPDQGREVSDGHIQTAVGYLQEAQVAEAIAEFDKAIRSDPSNVQAYLLLAQVYMRMNEFDRAVDTYLAAQRVEPDSGEIYYLLAIANGLRGQKDLAVQNAEKSLMIFQKEQNQENFRRALALLQGLAEEE
ncbi:MAG: tetratricopeptide repeat protein [Candidatus Omnitrophota bacterium]